MADVKQSPTFDRVRELLDYNYQSGKFIWRIGIRRGQVAGHHHKERDYCQLRIDQRLYPMARVVWLWVHGTWPLFTFDHINGVRNDNRIANLRPATAIQQNGNRVYKSRLGYPKGVSKSGSRYMARISKSNRDIYLGSFDTPEEAHEVYCKAAREHFGAEFFLPTRSRQHG